ncbi:MAG: hypothetical protein JWM27_4869 [Gemmatimonadetes bacterium]|nr:hypothetical protein [Gemmatimonadota bacterium]
MTRRDDVALFSVEELATGLARLSTPENGEEVARLVAALPQGERPFYRWAHEAVLLVSSVSLDVAERVRRHYGRDEESRALMAEHQELFARFLSSIGEAHPGKCYRLQDVVIDIRPEASPNLVPAYVAPRRRAGGNVLDIASEDELRAGLALVASDDNAREVAGAVYSIPPEEQVHYDWVHEVVMLLSCVSESLAARVRSRLAVFPEEREEIARLQRAWADHIRSRRGPRAGCFDVDGVIRDRRLDAGH